MSAVAITTAHIVAIAFGEGLVALVAAVAYLARRKEAS